MVTTDLENNLVLWDLNACDPSLEPLFLERDGEGINTLAFDSSNEWLITGREGAPDPDIRMWRIRIKSLISLAKQNCLETVDRRRKKQYLLP